MNTTANALLTAYNTAGATITSALSRFSFVQVPHIKLKAEHHALVLFHIVKICLAYWEGWRDGRRNGKDEKKEGRKGRIREKSSMKKSKSKSSNRGRKGRVIGKGKYTLVFQ
jgi:hypothetical protein